MSEKGEAERPDEVPELPEDADKIRRLHEGMEGLCSEQQESGSSLSERLAHLYGPEVDPSVSLQGQEQPASDFSSEVLKRLSDRLPITSRYKLEGEVARGGMGAILRVWDEDLRRHLAMKVVLGQGGEASKGDTPQVPATMLARFLEEAQVTGQLDHPGIVPVHELGLDAEGQFYFTMKLVKGKTLKDVFDELAAGEGGWTQTRVLGMLLKVCEAMAYAHDKGVIHRDLKPANVMVGKFGEVYVMDWGLAKILGREDTRDLRVRTEEPPATSELRSDRKDHAGELSDSPLYTMDGDVVGTPSYMSPEQAAGQVGDMGPQSDVYALGAMLYHLLAGQMPYVPQGARVSAYAVLMGVLAGPPRALHQVAPDVPAELVAICEKAMSRDAQARYANTSELAEDLSAYIDGRVVHAYETGAWAEGRKWVKRNKPLAASLAAAVLLAISGVGGTAYVQAKGKAAEKELRGIAEANENLAIKRADDVLRLSLAQDYEDLITEVDALWPPHPDKLDALRNWLTTARDLTASVPALVAKRDELRAGALELTEAERQVDREAHPEYGAFVQLQAEIVSKKSALAVRRGQAQVELPEVNWSNYAQDAGSLNSVAWPLVDPAREAFGQEALGLVLATRASELATDADRAAILTSVAWGRFALGDNERALEAAFTAFDQASEDQREEAGDTLAQLEEAVATASSGPGLEAAEAAIAELDSRAVELEARVNERRTWSFSAEQDGEMKTRWWHNQLTGLIAELESLRAPGSGLLTAEGVSAEHGWSVGKRQALAERLEAGFAPEGEFAQRWEESLPEIREAYPDLDLTPQMGLVPIGADAVSGLWEFWHVQSGSEPIRNDAGELVLEEDSGLVFVLLPGGAFWMGAQSTKPDGQNYDKFAESFESPVHEVLLSSFLLSKYEMTQGQWERLTGSNPSRWGPSFSIVGIQHDLTHPVEQVSWLDCMDLLPRAGLVLPSEAQWEYGARGGTGTVWWTGNERDSLRDRNAANLADQSAAQWRAVWHQINDWPELDDMFAAHAPVDEYAANPFGLHNVHGNVWEWCLDGYEDNFYSSGSVLDPVSPHFGSANSVVRSGGFDCTAADTRSAFRYNLAPTAAVPGLGLRPARVIEP